MSDVRDVLFATAIGVIAPALLAAAVGVARRNNGIADVFWGGLFIAGTVGGMLAAPEVSPGDLVVALAILVWGVRLIVHLARRARIHAGEDFRYAAMRTRWGPRGHALRSLVQVYALQAGLAWVILAPVMVTMASTVEVPPSLLVVGIVVFALGLATEVLADRELAAFRADRRAGTESARFCERGVWAVSRHPNYLGEAVAWWGIGVMALGAERGVVGLIGPLVVTVLVRWVSGVPMLERAWRERAGYEEWVGRVPVFVPWPWRIRRR